MSVSVKLPDGRVLKFDDGTSRENMQASVNEALATTGKTDIQTTEGMGFFERLWEQGKTAVGEVGAGIGALPHKATQVRSLQLGSEDDATKIYFERHPDELAAGRKPWPDELLKIRKELQTDEGPLFGEGVQKYGEENLPTVGNLLENYSKNAGALTVPQESSGRIYKAGVRGATAAVPAIATGNPLAVLTAAGSGGGSAVAGESLRQAGAPEGISTAVEAVGGMLTPELALAPGNLATKTARAAVGNTPAKMVLQTVKDTGASADDVGRAQAITARVAGEGMGAPTLDESMQLATGGQATPLTTLRRDIESTPEGAKVFNRATGDRQERVRAAMQRRLDQVAAPIGGQDILNVPSKLKSAAEDVAKDVRGIPTRQTADLYQGLRARDLTPSDRNAIGNMFNTSTTLRQAWTDTMETLADDGVAHSEWVRPDEHGIWRVTEMPEGVSAKRIDEILGDKITEAKKAGNSAKARSYTRLKNRFQSIMRKNISGLREADAEFERLKIQGEPWENTPTAKLADADANFDTQAANIIPEGGQKTVRPENLQRMARDLAIRDPDALPDFLRVNLESIFEETMKGTASSPARPGGPAATWGDIAGNRQKRANWIETIRATSGDEVANGLETVLEGMESYGFRPNTGSPTAEKGVRFKQLGSTGAIQNTAKFLTGPLKAIRERIEKHQFDRATRVLAYMIAEPENAGIFRQLAGMDPDSPNAMRLIADLLDRADEDIMRQPDTALTLRQQRRRGAAGTGALIGTTGAMATSEIEQQRKEQRYQRR